MPVHGNAEPGKYRSSRTPYVKGFQDAICEPGVEEIVAVWGTQVAKTTSEENILGYWIDNDPGPTLIVRPTEQSCGDYIKERLRPLLDSSPSLKQHVSPNRDDNTLRAINLDTMPIYFGWSGSAGSLASRPCRYVIYDECDKFEDFAGNEADPMSLASERTATYLHRRRIVKTSTPTTANGVIWRSFKACGDRRYYHVPCPHCGKYQRLVWSQVKWPKNEKDKSIAADQIEQNNLAWYECEKCNQKIHDYHKPKMLDRGIWASETQTVCDDGSLGGIRQKSKRVGFHLNSLYSPWRNFSSMAAEWLKAADDIGLMINFRNSRLAEPFEIQIASTSTDKVREKVVVASKPGIVPDWTYSVITTADVQADRIYFVTRAWGRGFKSQLLRCGSVLNFASLWETAFDSPLIWGQRYRYSDKLIIDGKYRKPEVVEFQKLDVTRIVRSIGLAQYNAPLVTYKVEQGGLPVVNVNTLLSKDRLYSVINDPDPTRWMPHNEVDDEYLQEMSSEHKIFDRDSKREVWRQKTSGRANHRWDCEANQCAYATLIHMDLPVEIVEERPQQPQLPTPQRRESWAGVNGRWIDQ